MVKCGRDSWEERMTGVEEEVADEDNGRSSGWDDVYLDGVWGKSELEDDKSKEDEVEDVGTWDKSWSSPGEDVVVVGRCSAGGIKFVVVEEELMTGLFWSAMSSTVSATSFISDPEVFWPEDWIVDKIDGVRRTTANGWSWKVNPFRVATELMAESFVSYVIRAFLESMPSKADEIDYA